MTPFVSLLVRKDWEAAVAKYVAAHEHADAPDPEDLATRCRVLDVQGGWVRDEVFIVEIAVEFGDDDASDPGVSQVRMGFTSASWAAFKAYVDAEMNQGGAA